MRASAAALSTTFVLLVSGLAEAASRPRFEPTDLELEDTGAAELDLQVGPTTGDARRGRVYAPDFELDVGVLPRLEFDLDGAFSIEPLRGGPGVGGPAHWVAAEPLWASAKLGLADIFDVGPSSIAAVGLQLGPRIPVVPGEHGAGYQIVLLGALHDTQRLHVVANAGGLVDPATTPNSKKRPYGIVGGVDVQVDLDPQEVWSLVGGVGAGYFVQVYPSQLTLTAGVQRSSDYLDVSLLGLTTAIGPSDRFGVLLGFAPRMRLF